jgi:hypothetical protein
MRGGYGVSGSYHLYRYATACTRRGQGCPTVRGSVFPNHAGMRAALQLQLFVDGRWRTALRTHVRLGRHSRATLRLVYRNASVIGVRARVRMSFPKHDDHLGGHSPWAYFIVTR